MPLERKNKTDIIEKIIYDTAYDAVCPLTVFNSSMNQMSSSTGFIVDIVQNRIIVLTCAHNILINSTQIGSDSYPTITANVTGAYPKGSCIRNEIPIGVSLRLLGMNVSADLAVLYSILPSEETTTSSMGYQFSRRTQRLDWAVRPVLYGETVYTLGNMYGSNLSMIAGNCADSNIIYLPESTEYMNSIQQIVTTLAVKGGASGGPILCYDDETKRAVICGIVQWSKVDNDYTAGLNTISLRRNYQKIYDLNIGCQAIKPNRLNFNGSTGKGYSGVKTYQHVSGGVLTKLNHQYQAFNRSKYRNQSSGIQIESFSEHAPVIPNSRVANAVNISRCDYLKKNTRAVAISDDRIKQGDILMEVDGQRLGDEGQELRLAYMNYYDAGKIRFVKCLNPETAEIRYYRYIVDRYPSELERVSVDGSIELVEIGLTWTTKPYELYYENMTRYINGYMPSIRPPPGLVTRPKVSFTWRNSNSNKTESFSYYSVIKDANTILYNFYGSINDAAYYDHDTLLRLRVYYTKDMDSFFYNFTNAILDDINANWTITVEEVQTTPRDVLIEYRPKISITAETKVVPDTTYVYSRIVYGAMVDDNGNAIGNPIDTGIYLYSYVDLFGDSVYYTLRGLQQKRNQFNDITIYTAPLDAIIQHIRTYGSWINTYSNAIWDSQEFNISYYKNTDPNPVSGLPPNSQIRRFRNDDIDKQQIPGYSLAIYVNNNGTELYSIDNKKYYSSVILYNLSSIYNPNENQRAYYNQLLIAIKSLTITDVQIEFQGTTVNMWTEYVLIFDQNTVSIKYYTPSSAPLANIKRFYIEALQEYSLVICATHGGTNLYSGDGIDYYPYESLQTIYNNGILWYPDNPQVRAYYGILYNAITTGDIP